MGDSHGVAVSDGIHNGANSIGCFSFREVVLFDNPVKQLPSLHDFEDQEELVLVLEYLKELDHIGMVYLAQNVNFLSQANQVVFREFFPDPKIPQT